jgi:gephyrin
MSSSDKLKAAILIISDTASKDASTDRAGPTLESVFADSGNEQWKVVETKIIPDDVLEIQRCITAWTDQEDGKLNLVLTSGGTGFAVKDRTPEVSWFRDEMDREREVLMKIRL